MTQARQRHSQRPDSPIGGDRTFEVVRPSAERLRLEVVLSQYDRKKYPHAVEHLVRLLDGLADTEYHLTVIDNANEGEWTHELSSNVTHAGGDNTACEFSAFDRGLAVRRASSKRPHVWLFVTDAYEAYGAEFLKLIDRRVIDQSLALGACIGWVDAYPSEVSIFGSTHRDWIRTSFLFVPERRLGEIIPFAAPLDPRELFGSEPGQPFAPNAPLSANFQAYLLEWLTRGSGARPRGLTEGWHSQFALTVDSFPRFQAKVCAILREHLLAVRIRRSEIPAYDFRLIPHIDTLSAADACKLRKWEWSSWQEILSTSGLGLPCQHFVDRLSVADSFEQGDDVQVDIEGWVLSDPPVETAKITVGKLQFIVPLGVCRADVRERFPDYGIDYSGFRLSASLSPLELGEHEIRLTWGRPETSVALKRVRVLSKVAFELTRMMVPEFSPSPAAIPLALEGILRSSREILGADLLIDGQLVSPLSLTNIPHTPGRVSQFSVAYCDNIQLERVAGQHTLTLRFHLNDGDFRSWTQLFTIRGVAALPWSLSEFRIGPYRPDCSSTELKLSGMLFGTEPGDELVLGCDGDIVLRRPLSQAKENPPPSAWFDIQGDFDCIAAGVRRLTLGVERRGRLIPVWEDCCQVRHERPELVVEEASFSYDQYGCIPLLSIRGWIRNHFAVDCLELKLDGLSVAVLGATALRPDVAKAFDSPLICRQGFEFNGSVAGTKPGEHKLTLTAYQRGGESTTVAREIRLEERPAEQLAIRSDSIEGLVRGTLRRFHSSIHVRGTISTQKAGVSAKLLVDEVVADDVDLKQGDDQVFSLRAVPTKSGNYRVRVLFTAGGRKLYDSRPIEVEFVRLDTHAGHRSTLEHFLRRFGLEQRIAGRLRTDELLRSILEEDLERLSDMNRLIEDVGARLGAGGKGPAKALAQPSPRNGTNPLKVLFVSWEVPSSEHGGGVHMVNVLRHAAERHEVTLLHSYGGRDVELVDEVRPYCKRVISIERTVQRAAYRHDAFLPTSLYEQYTPELRRAIELEVFTGGHDVVNYEYSALLPYVVEHGPRVLLEHEVGYTALLNTHFSEALTEGEATKRIRELIRVFHMNVVQVPRAFKHVIAVTEQDARALLDFAPDGRIYVQAPGVDCEHNSAPQLEEAPVENAAPKLVFVGGYRHSPNVRAAAYFAEQVMPLIHRAHPEVEFQIVGAHPPAELRALNGTNNVSVVGYVPDVRPYLHAAAAFVAPIHTGVGIRLKVLEAMACGAPVIGTILSMRGIGARDGTHFLRAESASEFAASVSAVLADPSRSKRIARAARSLVRAQHGWPARFATREAIWREAIAAEGTLRGKSTPRRRKPGREP